MYKLSELLVEENRGTSAELYRVVHHALQDGEHDKEARLPEHDVSADLAASVTSDTTMPQVSNKVRRKNSEQQISHEVHSKSIVLIYNYIRQYYFFHATVSYCIAKIFYYCLF